MLFLLNCMSQEGRGKLLLANPFYAYCRARYLVKRHHQQLCVIWMNKWLCGLDCFFRMLLMFIGRISYTLALPKIHLDNCRMWGNDKSQPYWFNSPFVLGEVKSWQSDAYLGLPSEFTREYQTCRVLWHHRFCSYSLARAFLFRIFIFTLPAMNNQISTETLQTKDGKNTFRHFFSCLQFGDTPFVLHSSVICSVHLFVTQLNSTARSIVRWLWVPCYRDILSND